MSEELTAAAADAFRRHFGTEPGATAFAPGRVNLMGEHTDYNGGCVLPVTLDLGIGAAVGKGSEPGVVRLVSDGFDGEDVRRADEAASGRWSDYAFGSLLAAGQPAIARDGLRIAISGDLPAGAGLSSSAAIEVATIRAIDTLLGCTRDPVAVAAMARFVENDFVGMPCGVMDQFAVSVGHPGAALFLNTATLAHQTVALLPNHAFLVIHAGVSHRLTDDGYATRVAECRAACAGLGVEALGTLDVNALDRIGALAHPLDRRARHVVTENHRVARALDAMRHGDAPGFGELMNASHASQRDDYDVSVPQIDSLVDEILKLGATGARLTGGGFGGSIVALVQSDLAKGIAAEIRCRLPETRLLAMLHKSA